MNKFQKILALGTFLVTNGLYSNAWAIDPYPVDPLLPLPPGGVAPQPQPLPLPPDFSRCNSWLSPALIAVVGGAAAQAGYQQCIADVVAEFKFPVADPVSPPWTPSGPNQFPKW